MKPPLKKIIYIIVAIVGLFASVKAQSAGLDNSGQLVQLVKAGAELILTKGEAAFNNFSSSGSRWRQDFM